MKTPHAPRDRLLAETFHGNWEEGVGAQFARRAAAHARNRRRRRQAGAAATAIVALLILTSLALRQPPVTPASGSPPASTPAYEVISDAELLAELRDRPLVVVKRANGANDFVLVGQ